MGASVLCDSIYSAWNHCSPLHYEIRIRAQYTSTDPYQSTVHDRLPAAGEPQRNFLIRSAILGGCRKY